MVVLRSSFRYRRQRAAVLTELAIALPLLVICMIAPFEIGRALSMYLILTDSAYIGARTGSQLTPNELTAGCFPGLVLDDLEGTTAHESHKKVMQRVVSVVEMQGRNLTVTCDESRPNNKCGDPAFADRPTIKAEYIRANASTSAQRCGKPVTARNTYAVQITGYYEPLLFPWRIKMQAESRASLLGNNQTFCTTCGGIKGGGIWQEIEPNTHLSNPHLFPPTQPF